jgi:hypothetical protein
MAVFLHLLLLLPSLCLPADPTPWRKSRAANPVAIAAVAVVAVVTIMAVVMEAPTTITVAVEMAKMAVHI